MSEDRLRRGWLLQAEAARAKRVSEKARRKEEIARLKSPEERHRALTKYCMEDNPKIRDYLEKSPEENPGIDAATLLERIEGAQGEDDDV